MMELVLWGSAGIVGFTYLGFPLLVLLRARVRPRPVAAADVTPSVSVIIAAHDERASIGPRIDNLLALDYPRERLEIVVASDGSTDDTVAVARSRGETAVRVLDLPRVGKATALNRAVEASTGEILVFSDANTAFAPDAIRALVRSFADPEVGGVAGNQVYGDLTAPERRETGDATAAGAGERRYWDFDRILKVAESLGGNVISATGAIYALRRELFRTVPDGVTDDFVTSTRVIQQGRRLVFEPDAMAFEPVAGSSKREYRRKVRIMTRGLRGVSYVRSLLDPRRYGFYSVQLFVHKVLRRMMALPLLAIGLASLALWDHGNPLYRLLAVGQAALYGLAAIGLGLRDRPEGQRPWFSLPAFFALVNIASLHALWNLVSGRRIDRWEPNRVVELPAEAEG